MGLQYSTISRLVFIVSIVSFQLTGASEFAYSQCAVTINTFPYNEDFETSQGNWNSGGTNNDWAWGIPVKPVISGASSGVKCWIAGGLGNAFYNGAERSWVQSPCFDFTNVSNPMFIADIFWETEKTYDGATLQYSFNGINWTNVGSVGQVNDCMNQNWFNTSGIINLATLATPTDGWSGNVQPTIGNCLGGNGSNGWITVKQLMPYLGGKPQVMFRFCFGSGTTCNNFDGFAFDHITIQQAPALLSLSGYASPQGCNQSNGVAAIIINSGSAPYSYLWSTGATTDTVFNLTAATYTVTVTDGNGCTKSDAVTINTAPAVTLAGIAYSDTCSGGNGMAIAIAAGGTAPFLFLWSTGNTGDTIYNITPNNYNVTVTDAQGCTATASVTIDDYNNFEFDLGSDTGVCLLKPFFLSAGIQASYLWQNGSTQSSLLITDAGRYWVEVISDIGCRASDTVFVYDNCLGDVIAPNAFTPNSDMLNEVFLVYTPYAENFLMIIYNRFGQPIFESKNVNQGWDGNISNQPAPEGVYMWQVKYSNADTTPVIRKGLVRLIR